MIVVPTLTRPDVPLRVVSVAAVPTIFPTVILGLPERPKEVVAKDTDEIPVRFAPLPTKDVAVMIPAAALIPDALMVTPEPTTTLVAVAAPNTGVTIYGNSGIVSATSFYGSGANLTGIANTANIVSTAITTGTLNVTTSAIVGTAVTINSSGINAAAGIITATSFVGSGANLTGVISGVEIKSAGTSVGTGITNINFIGATATATGSASTITITVTASFNELDATLFS